MEMETWILPKYNGNKSLRPGLSITQDRININARAVELMQLTHGERLAFVKNKDWPQNPDVYIGRNAMGWRAGKCSKTTKILALAARGIGSADIFTSKLYQISPAEMDGALKGLYKLVPVLEPEHIQRIKKPMDACAK